jgi:ferrous-iron efflux pump FieF
MTHISAGDAKENQALSATVAGAIDVLVTLGALMASRSTVILADFFKTFLEFLTVLLAWLAIRRIKKGANHDFQYGVGKLENLISLLVGSVMILCILLVVAGAVRGLLHPSHVSGIGVWISVIAQVVYAGVNGLLYRRMRLTAQQENSPIMASQARLLLGKALANIFILVSLVLSMALQAHTWSAYIDPLSSLAIAGFLLLAATGLFRSTINDLLDGALEEESQMMILQVLARHFADYEALHGFRTRRAGSAVFVELFLEFNPTRHAGEVQDIIDRIQSEIESKIRGSRVCVALTRKRIAH